jgi:hypothetical protein
LLDRDDIVRDGDLSSNDKPPGNRIRIARWERDPECSGCAAP